MNDNNKIKVSIQCLVYNHEPYIRQCLDGIVMQKTNFRYEAIIHDDASTDGSTAIIREYAEKYPDIIKPIIEKENLYSKGPWQLFKKMKLHSYGMYIALCEGDDYWIDPWKLQKQVDVLEKNKNVTMVYTGFNLCGDVTEGDRRFYSENQTKFSKNGDMLPELFGRNFIQTVTVCYRKSSLERSLYESSPSFLDYSLFLALAANGPFIYLNDKTACYRINPAGMVRGSTNKLKVRIRMIKQFYASRYLDGSIPRRKDANDSIILKYISSKTSFNRKLPMRYWLPSFYYNFTFLAKDLVKKILGI